jgi:pyruvate formate lyase activating enzyme
MKVNALFYEASSNDSVKCILCPHNCVILSGKTGLCRTRMNVDGELFSLNYSDITSFGVDPIEKKPLFHFKPNDEVLSLGTWGCNFKCPFCQNFEISQEMPESLKKINHKTLSTFLDKYNVKGIAFTYSEPSVWFEFILDTCRELKNNEKEYYTVMVTNGYINSKPLKLLLQHIDAMNIDVKSFNEEKHLKTLGGELKHIKKTVEIAYESKTHLELTTLIVPGFNDDLEELENEFKWISGISKDIPLHLSKYFPRYNYNNPATDEGFLIEVYNTAKKYLDYVYIGNMWNKNYESTICPECGELLIERKAYNVKIKNLNEYGGCENCKKQIVIK